MEISNYNRAEQARAFIDSLSSYKIVLGRSTAWSSGGTPAEYDRVTPMKVTDIISAGYSALVEYYGVTDYTTNSAASDDASKPTASANGNFPYLSSKFVSFFGDDVANIKSNLRYGVCVQITLTNSKDVGLEFNQVGFSDKDISAITADSGIIMAENIQNVIIVAKSTLILRIIVNF